MGYGFPAAIGAQLGQPNDTVIAVVGDGGFQMTAFELSTAVIHKLPVKILIIDNKYLGMVRQWQELFYDDRYSGVDLEGNPDFVKLGESYGCKGFRIKRPADVEKILKRAFDYNDGPCIIHAEVVKEDNVFPMVPAGGAAEDMIIEPPKTKNGKTEREYMMSPDLHTISLFVANKPGVLLRITLMFARRGYNIESLVVSSALNGDFSRMTITASGDPKTLDQIIRQANKLVDVVSASEHNDEDAVESEMALIKMAVSPNNRTDILQVVEHFKAETMDLTTNHLIIQATGTHDKINTMITMLSEFEILEVVRSGKMAIARGKEST